jgi:hypothetical protein
MSSLHESELEMELEQALQEAEAEGEAESELEAEAESESGEHFLGAIGNVLGGLFGESELEGEGELEMELEGEGELEMELEGELESGEHFFGGLKKLLSKAAPILKSVAKVAAPVVASAIGGPGAGALVGKLAGSLLEHEHELEGELELEHELEHEHEHEHEVAHEIASHELTEHEAMAELMAEAAALESGEGQAEAMAGASAVTIISAADRRALRQVLPHLVRGTAILTRILRRRRITRPAVRAVPTIMRRTVGTLRRQAAAGQPITRRRAARVAATQIRKVIGNPRACQAAIVRNIKTTRVVKRAPKRFRAIAG